MGKLLKKYSNTVQSVGCCVRSRVVFIFMADVSEDMEQTIYIIMFSS